jgi:REP element-mobilizing transposase RayT
MTFGFISFRCLCTLLNAMSAYVRWLVAQKRQWHHPPDPDERSLGFRGWHTRGYLPHFGVPGVQQMVNFRLADALPQQRQHEWALLHQIKDERERRVRLEEYYDLGYGACELAIPAVAQCVENTILHDDNRRCRVLAWVIMPNHVHLLIEVWTTPLTKLLKDWKSVTSHYVNKAMGRSGAWWQQDYFDRYIRDEAHFHKAVHYIENNPAKAGLVKEPKAWPFSSARWRQQGFGLQPVQGPS